MSQTQRDNNEVEQLMDIVRAQQRQIEALAEHVGIDEQQLLSRRDLLQAGGGAALLLAASQTAAADGSLNDGDTQWGSNQNRDDYLVDVLDANSVQTDALSVGGRSSDQHYRLIGKTVFSSLSGSGQKPVSVDTTGVAVNGDGFNHYLVYYYVQSDQRSTANYDLRINDDTDSIYDTRFDDGSSTSGSSIVLIDASDSYVGGSGWVYLRQTPSSVSILHSGWGRVSRLNKIGSVGTYKVNGQINSIDLLLPSGGGGSADLGAFVWVSNPQ